MQAILDHIRRQANGAVNGIDQVRIGIVTGNYDPTTYSCKVLIQPGDKTYPDGYLTGYLPIKGIWGGNGWGLFAPPPAGSKVAVIPVEGSLEAAYIDPFFFYEDHQPVPVPQGEFWLVHQSGSALKFLNDGTVELSAHNNLSVTAPEIDLNGYVKTSNHVEVKTGASGVFSDKAGKTVTVKNGIVVGIK